MRQTIKRGISIAVAATFALSAAGFGATPALAAGHAKQTATVANTDISAARHHRVYRHHYRRGNSAAAIGAFTAFAGAIAAIAASQRYRDDYYYEPYGYYGGGYGYYGGGGYGYRGGYRHFGGGVHHFHGGGHHGGGHHHR